MKVSPGWGSAGPINSGTVRSLRKYIVGRDPFDANPIEREINNPGNVRTILGHFGTRLLNVTGGISMALWDIIGKACGQPVCKLIGGRYRERVETRYWSCVKRPEDQAEEAVKAVKSGWKALKIKLVPSFSEKSFWTIGTDLHVRCTEMRTDLELLRGAIDMHVHSAPDLFARSCDHLELALDALQHGMRAVALKCHFAMTPFRAAVVERAVSGDVKVFGGIVLNHAVGGFNPYAVDAALKAGAKIVWMPTISAANHLKHYGFGAYKAQRVLGGDLLPFKEGLTPLKGGGIVAELSQILGLIADANAILGTSHFSVEESKVLVEEAKRVGVKKIVVTHPEFEVVNMPVKDQIELARKGAYMERTILPVTPMWRTMDVDAMVKIIKDVGADHAIMATDLGQVHNPKPVEGYRMFIQMLLEKGMTPQEIEVMAKTNPARLLDLELQT